jgi:hypothetical protein
MASQPGDCGEWRRIPSAGRTWPACSRTCRPVRVLHAAPKPPGPGTAGEFLGLARSARCPRQSLAPAIDEREGAGGESRARDDLEPPGTRYVGEESTAVPGDVREDGQAILIDHVEAGK